MIVLLTACLEQALPLPPSRLTQPSTGMMVQYSQLKGFLVSRGTPKEYYLWSIHTLDETTKKCALEKIPLHAQALMVRDQDIKYAHNYFSTKTDTVNREALKCP